MKICSDCKTEKSLEYFNYDKSRNRYLSVCKPCVAVRTEAYRQNNKNKWRTQSKNHSLKRKNIIDEWKSQGCFKCGDQRFYIIDAHHTDPSQKKFSIGTSIRGVNVTKSELEKCIPLCSNCHREFHHFEKEKGITLAEYLENQK
jgi:hypothetical protein